MENFQGLNGKLFYLSVEHKGSYYSFPFNSRHKGVIYWVFCSRFHILIQPAAYFSITNRPVMPWMRNSHVSYGLLYIEGWTENCCKHLLISYLRTTVFKFNIKQLSCCFTLRAIRGVCKFCNKVNEETHKNPDTHKKKIT